MATTTFTPAMVDRLAHGLAFSASSASKRLQCGSKASSSRFRTPRRTYVFGFGRVRTRRAFPFERALGFPTKREVGFLRKAVAWMARVVFDPVKSRGRKGRGRTSKEEETPVPDRSGGSTGFDSRSIGFRRGTRPPFDWKDGNLSNRNKEMLFPSSGSSGSCVGWRTRGPRPRPHTSSFPPSCGHPSHALSRLETWTRRGAPSPPPRASLLPVSRFKDSLLSRSSPRV